MRNIKKYKLFTEENITYKDITTFTQDITGLELEEELNTTISYPCLLTNKYNLIKALKSIKHNGVSGLDVTDLNTFMQLIIDYTDIKTTGNGDCILLLELDSEEEGQYNIAYQLSDMEKLQYHKLTDEKKYEFIIDLVQSFNNLSIVV